MADMPSHLGEVIVQAHGIHKFFGDNHVLRGVDLDVWQGEAVMLVGRSGSGKTTLLRCINFLEEPTLGTCRRRRRRAWRPIRSDERHAQHHGGHPPDPAARRDAVPGLQPASRT